MEKRDKVSRNKKQVDQLRLDSQDEKIKRTYENPANMMKKNMKLLSDN